MRKPYLILFILFFLSTVCFSQNLSWEWAVGLGGSKSDEVYDITGDNYGNIYVTGAFLDSSITAGQLTLNVNAYYGAYLAKFDSSGNPIWIRGASSTQVTYGYSVVTDNKEAVYLYGSFQDGLQFPSDSLAGNKTFIAKYGSWILLMIQMGIYI